MKLHFLALPGLLLATPALAVQVTAQRVSGHGAGNRTQRADVPYSVIDLGVLPGFDSHSEPVDINESGQVLCHSWRYVSTFSHYHHAFTWTQGVVVDLGELPGLPDTFGAALNDAGQVVGHSSAPGVSPHAFLWENGVMTDLGTLPGTTESYATGLDDAGVVIGYSKTATGLARPWRWQNGTLQDIGFNATFATPTDIDAAGRIYGTAGIDGETYGAYFDVDEWHQMYIFLDSPMRCSDAGALTGTGYHSLTWVAFARPVGGGGSTFWLPSLPGNTTCRGYGINDQGVVVGTAAGGAVLWRNSAIESLYAMIDPDLGLLVKWGAAIDESGRIAAFARINATGEHRAVLLTPQ